MPNALFDALFGIHANRSTPFLHLPDEHTISHAVFLKTTAQFAHAIKDAGLCPGDRLAVQVAKSPDALALYAACVQSGIIFLPLNTAYKSTELAYFVDDSGAKLVICDDANIGKLQSVLSPLGAELQTLNGNGTGSFKNIAASKPTVFQTVDRSKDDLAAFLYTSGTTGRSKGAMLTHGNLLSNAQTLVEFWEFSEADVLLHALPIFHTHGLFVATNVVLASGGAMIFLPKFDKDEVIGYLPKATTLMGVPTFYTRLLSDQRLDKKLVAHMRLFVSGSAPLLAETHLEFEGRTGHRILERYGMTETNMNTSNPYEGERRAGTVGFPLPGVELKITHPETNKTLDTGQVGQIEVRGPNVFKGYWQMPEKTAAELREDGFFITGDLGKIDEGGYVHIVGREKDLIISGGYNIYPKEIETILDAQATVSESAVIGVPHDDLGETILALLVPMEGQIPDIEEIKMDIATQVAGFKRPREFIIVEELPRNTMGKVQKNVLRDTYKDQFQLN